MGGIWLAGRRRMFACLLLISLSEPCFASNCRASVDRFLAAMPRARKDVVDQELVHQATPNDCSAASTLTLLKALFRMQNLDQSTLPKSTLELAASASAEWATRVGPGGRGVPLVKLERYLNALKMPLLVTRHHADELTFAEFSKRLGAYSKNKKQLILVNFDQAIARGDRGHYGHYAVLSDFNERTQMAWLSDPDPEAGSYSVQTEKLWQSLNTVDDETGASRGFLVLSLVIE
jgi:hypothetical protein